MTRFHSLVPRPFLLVAALSCCCFLLLVLLLSKMAEKDGLRVGAKVWVKDKDLYGTVRSVDERASGQIYPNTYLLTYRFMGTTEFAPGKWIGVELFDPRGKNSGSVNGKEYFRCAEHHGLFLRAPQIQVRERGRQRDDVLASHWVVVTDSCSLSVFSVTGGG